jgi:hypothetical protein
VTGFIARDVDQLVAAVGPLDEIDPAGCAAEGRRRFSPRQMAEGYLKIYRQEEAAVPELEWKVIEKAPPNPRAGRPSPAGEIWDEYPEE